MAVHTLGAGDLSIEDVARIARDPNAQIACAPEAMARVEACRREIDEIVERYQASQSGEAQPNLDYGVTTGFGEFKRIPIPPAELRRLQSNIVLSHAGGVGINSNPRDLSNYYPGDVVRAAMLLRINAFLHGHSGVTRELVERFIAIFNACVIPLVPIRGSVGSSGDLCPLAHLALIVFEEGRQHTWFYQATDAAQLLQHPALSFNEDGSANTACPIRRAAEIGSALKIPVHELQEKEGLALTNGATFSAAMLALSVHDAERLLDVADIAAAMCLEASRGCARAFDPRVHEIRRQQGQIETARNIRNLVSGSKLVETFSEVQDPYSVRCAPAVHGASRDTVAFARTVAEREINAATDNPLFFGDDQTRGHRGWDGEFAANWKHRFDKNGKREHYDGDSRHSFSAGNFHGQPIGIVADYLAIAMAEIANISERRTQFLMDSDHNRGLPANLIANAGLNSGFMIAQYTAAGLVSENKVFAHPASVDSIPTSSNSEDHNAMATIAVVKLRHVMSLVQFTLAIELMVNAQAVEWASLYVHRVWPAAESGKSSDAAVQAFLDAKHRKQQLTEAATWTERQQAQNDYAAAETALFAWWSSEHRADIEAVLGTGTRAAYRRLRKAIAPLTKDVFLASYIAKVGDTIGAAATTSSDASLRDAVSSAVQFTKPT